MSTSLEAKAIKFHVPLTPTQQAFVESDAPIVAIIGPEGEGKTYTGLAAAIYHAERRMNGKPLSGAIIRDTFENIKNKTRDSIQKAIQTIADENDDPAYCGAWRWSDGGRQLTGPHGIHFNLFGANELGDLTRLQGADMWSFIWIEEPAPMYLGNNAGVPKEVFDACVSRAARGGGAMRLQITMNPADEEHWTFDKLKKNPIMRPPETPDIWTEVFHIPYGDNPARTELMRQATMAAYKDDEALYARLVKGEFAFVKLGPEVTPEYKAVVDGRAWHYTGKPIAVIPKAYGVRSWDGGHWPTCIIGQITSLGRLQIIHCFRGEHIGMKQLIETRVKPILALRYSGITDWFDTGDPSLETGDDSDIEQSPKRVIEKQLNTVFQGASHWPAVKEPMKAALNLAIDGKPYVEVGSEAEILHKALRGGWHYKKLTTGEILKDKPEKDKHSHPGDCFGALCLKLLGAQPKKKAPESKPAPAFTGPHDWQGL